MNYHFIYRYAAGMLVLLLAPTVAVTAQTATTLTDQDGNHYSTQKMADNRVWLMQNLAVNIPGSYCYNDSVEHCKKYGRLYTWAAAAEGCKILGEGWRLPTDAEWLQLTGQYGAVYGIAADSGKAAYQSLLQDGASGFNVLLGGGGDPAQRTYGRLERHGFYWTATETDAGNAWFYNFGKGRKMLYRQRDGEQSGAYSVRCISAEKK